ncbi:hypothetical protein RMDY18_13030 [Rothia mucilaginosa DY-18]|uniref:Uncharacterized protein n=1 Tax=Rothia mucilaginosa (strain DY-18) TaxID=680646 RepID=D2NU09_ROTMD|nr:hypothetical protein RMDY18_13030 [Rothia mucilaginosa DY-18]
MHKTNGSRAPPTRGGGAREIRALVDQTQTVLLNRQKELHVAFSLTQLVGQNAQSLLRLHTRQGTAQTPHNLDLIRGEQVLLTASTRSININRREDTLIRQLTGQTQLHVTGALELFEDHFVHLRAGLNQGGSQNGQRAALFNVAGRTEELLRRVQRGRIHTTGQDTTGCGSRQVVCTAQAGHGVQQHDHIVAELHHTLRTLNSQLSHSGVILSRAVEGRGNNLALNGALHIGHFFRTLIHQDHHQVHVRVVHGNRVRNGLQHEGLTRLRRGHNQTTLALTNRGHQVHHAGAQLLRGGLQAQTLLGVQRSQLREDAAVRCFLNALTVNRLNLNQCVETLAAVRLTLTRHTNRAEHVVTLTQVVLLHLSQGDVHVVGAGQVAGGTHESVVIENVQNTRNRCQHIVFAQARLVLLAAASLLLSTLSLTVTLGTALSTLGALGTLCTLSSLTLGTFTTLSAALCTLSLTVTLSAALGTLTILIAATLTSAGTLRALLTVGGTKSHIQGSVQAVQARGAVSGSSLQLSRVTGQVNLLRTLANTLSGQLSAHIQRRKLSGILVLTGAAGTLLRLLVHLSRCVLTLSGTASARTLLSGSLVTRGAGTLLRLFSLLNALSGGFSSLSVFGFLSLRLGVLLGASTAGTARLRLFSLLSIGSLGKLSSSLSGRFGLRCLRLGRSRSGYGATTLMLLKSLNQLGLLQLQVAADTKLLGEDTQLRDLQVCKFRCGSCRTVLIGDNNILCQLQFLWL